MVDYKAHLEKGLSAYREAQAARQEINSVFSELNSQLDSFTGGLVGLKFKEEITSALASATLKFSLYGQNKGDVRTYSIVAYDKAGKSGKEMSLSTWSQENTGYPCTMRFDNIKYDIYDRSSLEDALAALLTTPDTGKAIAVITAAAKAALEKSSDATD